MTEKNPRKNYFLVNCYNKIITSKSDFDEKELEGMYFEDENAFNQFKIDYANLFDFSSILYFDTEKYYLWNISSKIYESAEVVLDMYESFYDNAKTDLQVLRSEVVSNKRNKLLTE